MDQPGTSKDYFSPKEIDSLITLVNRFSHIIDDKSKDITVMKKQEQAWCRIAFLFNKCTFESPRNAQILKTKYEKIKEDIRQRFSSTKTISDVQFCSEDCSELYQLVKRIYEEIKNTIRREIKGKMSYSEPELFDIGNFEDYLITQPSLDQGQESFVIVPESGNNDTTNNSSENTNMPGTSKSENQLGRRKFSLPGQRISSKREKLLDILISTAKQKKEHITVRHKKRLSILNEQERQEKMKTKLWQLKLASEEVTLDDCKNSEDIQKEDDILL